MGKLKEHNNHFGLISLSLPRCICLTFKNFGRFTIFIILSNKMVQFVQLKIFSKIRKLRQPRHGYNRKQRLRGCNDLKYSRLDIHRPMKGTVFQIHKLMERNNHFGLSELGSTFCGRWFPTPNLWDSLYCDCMTQDFLGPTQNLKSDMKLSNPLFQGAKMSQILVGTNLCGFSKKKKFKKGRNRGGKKINLTVLRYLRLNRFCSFLEELRIPKRTYEINWPLVVNNGQNLVNAVKVWTLV